MGYKTKVAELNITTFRLHLVGNSEYGLPTGWRIVKNEDEVTVSYYHPESDTSQVDRPEVAKNEPQARVEWACRATTNVAETYIHDATGEIWHEGDENI